MTTAAPLDVEQECRAYFPSLQKDYIFADNAGGSQVRFALLWSRGVMIDRLSLAYQCLKDVADRVYDYLINTNVQLGMLFSLGVDASYLIRLPS